MSNKYFIHATPTLFNGTNRPQLKLFLTCNERYSIDGIYSTLRDCALISKWASAVLVFHTHNIRAKYDCYQRNKWIKWSCSYVARIQ